MWETYPGWETQKCGDCGGYCIGYKKKTTPATRHGCRHSTFDVAKDDLACRLFYSREEPTPPEIKLPYIAYRNMDGQVIQAHIPNEEFNTIFPNTSGRMPTKPLLPPFASKSKYDRLEQRYLKACDIVCEVNSKYDLGLPGEDGFTVLVAAYEKLAAVSQEPVYFTRQSWLNLFERMERLQIEQDLTLDEVRDVMWESIKFPEMAIPMSVMDEALNMLKEQRRLCGLATNNEKVKGRGEGHEYAIQIISEALDPYRVTTPDPETDTPKILKYRWQCDNCGRTLQGPTPYQHCRDCVSTFGKAMVDQKLYIKQLNDEEAGEIPEPGE